MPPAIETMMGLATGFNASATALARAKWPIPTPLLVARMIVGLDISYPTKSATDDLLHNQQMIEFQ
jgi:hypothetical protein